MLWADILSDRKQYDLSVNLKVMFFSKYSFSSIFQNRWFVQMRDQEIQPVTITVNSKSMLRFGLHVSINRCRYRLQLLHEDWGSIAWWQSKNQVLQAMCEEWKCRYVTLPSQFLWKQMEMLRDQTNPLLRILEVTSLQRTVDGQWTWVSDFYHWQHVIFWEKKDEIKWKLGENRVRIRWKIMIAKRAEGD